MRIGNDEVQIVQIDRGTMLAVGSRMCEVRINGTCVLRANYATCEKDVRYRYPAAEVLPALEIPASAR